MQKYLTVTAFFVIGLTDRAEAANFAVVTSPPTMLNLLILVLAVAGGVVGSQVLATVKGGFLSRAWQVFVAGFGVLALGQVSALLQTFEIVSIPEWVTPSLMVMGVGIFFYAVFETKRVLS